MDIVRFSFEHGSRITKRAQSGLPHGVAVAEDADFMPKILVTCSRGLRIVPKIVLIEIISVMCVGIRE